MIDDNAIAEFSAVVTQIPGWPMGETVFRMTETVGLKHITVAQLADWYWPASPGDVLVYGEGDLAYARYRSEKNHDSGFSELSTLAETAYDYSQLKRACLTQKRIEGGGFRYLITKRADKTKLPEPAAVIPVVLDHTEPAAAGTILLTALIDPSIEDFSGAEIASIEESSND